MYLSLFRNVLRHSARIAALMSLLVVSALAAQAQVVFLPPKNISNSSGNTQSQQVAVDSSGNINVVWADNSLGNYAIFVSRSSDGGATFSTPANISKHAQGTASGPQIIAGSSGNFSVVWTETSPDGSANFVYFSRSTDGGVTYSNPQNISGDAGAATGPRLAVDSGISAQGFSFTTSPVTAPTSVTVTASYNGGTVSSTVTVNP